jgi:hypothetical protein
VPRDLDIEPIKPDHFQVLALGFVIEGTYYKARKRRQGGLRGSTLAYRVLEEKARLQEAWSSDHVL